MTSKNKIQSLNLTSGTIEYRYDYNGSDEIFEDEEEKEEELFFTKEFSNLQELLMLTAEKTVEDCRIKENYTKVWIQSVSFHAKSSDGKTKLDCLMMDDHLNSFELIQVA